MLQVRGEVGPDLLGALGLIGVVADHETLVRAPSSPSPTPPGPTRDLLDPQVVGHAAVVTGAGERGGWSRVGVAQLLGVDELPGAAPRLVTRPGRSAVAASAADTGHGEDDGHDDHARQ